MVLLLFANTNFKFQVSSLFGNALSLSAHEHINIQTIIIQKYRITSMADQIYLLTDFYHPIL